MRFLAAKRITADAPRPGQIGASAPSPGGGTRGCGQSIGLPHHRGVPAATGAGIGPQPVRGGGVPCRRAGWRAGACSRLLSSPAGANASAPWAGAGAGGGARACSIRRGAFLGTGLATTCARRRWVPRVNGLASRPGPTAARAVSGRGRECCPPALRRECCPTASHARHLRQQRGGRRGRARREAGGETFTTSPDTVRAVMGGGAAPAARAFRSTAGSGSRGGAGPARQPARASRRGLLLTSAWRLLQLQLTAFTVAIDNSTAALDHVYIYTLLIVQCNKPETSQP